MSFKHLFRITLTLSTLLILSVLTGCSHPLPELSSIELSGKKYDPDTTQLTLTELASDDYSVFAKFHHLETLDVTAIDLSFEDFDRLSSQVGESVEIIWSVPFDNTKIRSNTPELNESYSVLAKNLNAVKYFNHLDKLTISDAEIDENLYTIMNTANEHNPDLQINCNASVYGVPFDNTTELLDLNNIPIDSPDKICQVIELFPIIKTIEMCDCGLSNSIMQGLREEYPDIKFVWTISFLHFKIRTDIQVFSTLATNFTRPGNTETFTPIFKYCTELRALDLGHMAITDISEIKNLKKLHTLILADNHITDISPLSELKEIVYLEIFQNRITDISPVLELPKLEDLNLCYNMRLQNPTVLTGCPHLKRLYISYCGLDYDELTTLKNGIPADCEFNYTAPNCVFSGWRTTANARNTKIREAFRNWRKVKEYPTWDNIIYK